MLDLQYVNDGSATRLSDKIWARRGVFTEDF
jgi:hypothetical protein